LQALGLGIATAAGMAALKPDVARAADAAMLMPPGAARLKDLTDHLARAAHPRDFKTVPMILTDGNQWDHEALTALIACKATPRQVWDNTDIAGPWLNGMRNALNTQIWSFKHPEALVVSATHGPAHLALYDQATWDKYQLAKIAGAGFDTNTLILEKKAGSADPANFEDPAGVFSPQDNAIPALMRRGVVFLGCHNAIWELASKLKDSTNPDGLALEALAAELTNHLIPGVVLTPGVVATIAELQQAGFTYVR
jgi:intracellular sulfur oxidation DsrE/DsrF family protein